MLFVIQALKGLILERTGKSEEALQLCSQVKEKKPSDEPILQALTMVYRSLGKRIIIYILSFLFTFSYYYCLHFIYFF